MAILPKLTIELAYDSGRRAWVLAQSLPGRDSLLTHSWRATAGGLDDDALADMAAVVEDAVLIAVQLFGAQMRHPREEGTSALRSERTTASYS